MADVPFELRYWLSRRQRLVPHLMLWGPLTLLIPLVLVVFLGMVLETWWAVFPLVLWVLVFRNFFLGIADVLFHRRASMDLRVEENGLGVLLGGERWYLFLDGLTSIGQLTPGVWTLQHWNGSVVHIPADAITDDQLAHLRAAMERGQTPEGIRAVIERGRRLAEMECPGRQGPVKPGAPPSRCHSTDFPGFEPPERPPGR